MNEMARLSVSNLGKPATPSCPECGSRFRRSLLPFRMNGRLFGYFPADVCRNGHDYYPEESRAAIEAIAKAFGSWGVERAATRSSSNRPRARRPPAASVSVPRVRGTRRGMPGS